MGLLLGYPHLPPKVTVGQVKKDLVPFRPTPPVRSFISEIRVHRGGEKDFRRFVPGLTGGSRDWTTGRWNEWLFEKKMVNDGGGTASEFDGIRLHIFPFARVVNAGGEKGVGPKKGWWNSRFTFPQARTLAEYVSWRKTNADTNWPTLSTVPLFPQGIRFWRHYGLSPFHLYFSDPLLRMVVGLSKGTCDVFRGECKMVVMTTVGLNVGGWSFARSFHWIFKGNPNFIR